MSMIKSDIIDYTANVIVYYGYILIIIVWVWDYLLWTRCKS